MALESQRVQAEKRMAADPPVYPPDLPQVRRRLIVEDYDFGLVRHEFLLEKTGRRDVYLVSVDGQQIGRMDWSRVVELARKGFVRVGSVT
jgi:hypothetical protein